MSSRARTNEPTTNTREQYSMRKTLIALAAAAAAVTAVATPASAITRGGEQDGNDHPYVGLARMFDADGIYQGRCSGALIDANTFVTAGHCTEGATFVDLYFGDDLTDEPDEYPATRNERTGRDATGTPYDHPQYLPAAFFVYDLGVVLIDGEGYTPRDDAGQASFASLPDEGIVDTFTSGRNKPTSTVTAVGYGLQKIIEKAQGVGQEFVIAEPIRFQADLMVVDTRGVAGLGSFFKAFDGSGSFVVSGDAKHGGTCFGDSGGPMLVGDTIVAVNSFGLNGNCAGIGGVYRIDQADDIGFIECLRQADEPESCYAES